MVKSATSKSSPALQPVRTDAAVDSQLTQDSQKKAPGLMKSLGCIREADSSTEHLPATRKHTPKALAPRNGLSATADASTAAQGTSAGTEPFPPLEPERRKGIDQPQSPREFQEMAESPRSRGSRTGSLLTSLSRSKTSAGTTRKDREKDKDEKVPLHRSLSETFLQAFTSKKSRTNSNPKAPITARKDPRAHAPALTDSQREVWAHVLKPLADQVEKHVSLIGMSDLKAFDDAASKHPGLTAALAMAREVQPMVEDNLRGATEQTEKRLALSEKEKPENESAEEFEARHLESENECRRNVHSCATDVWKNWTKVLDKAIDKGLEKHPDDAPKLLELGDHWDRARTTAMAFLDSTYVAKLEKSDDAEAPKTDPVKSA